MEKPEIAQKGPYVMDMEAGTYYFCACGKSKNQPFCDGSHRDHFEHEAIAFALPPKK